MHRIQSCYLLLRLEHHTVFKSKAEPLLHSINHIYNLYKFNNDKVSPQMIRAITGLFLARETWDQHRPSCNVQWGLEPPYHDNSHYGGVTGGLYMKGNQELNQRECIQQKS